MIGKNIIFKDFVNRLILLGTYPCAEKGNVNTCKIEWIGWYAWKKWDMNCK